MKQDKYRVNFSKIGPWIDRKFGLDNLFTNFLKQAQNALNSYTHAGVYPLGKQFKGDYWNQITGKTKSSR